jgi:hypothetical protein
MTIRKRKDWQQKGKIMFDKVDAKKMVRKIQPFKQRSSNDLKDCLMSNKISEKKKVLIKELLAQKAIEDERDWKMIPKFFTSPPLELAKASLCMKKSPYIYAVEHSPSDICDEQGHRLTSIEPQRSTRTLHYDVENYPMSEILCAVLDEYQLIRKDYYKAIDRAKKINPKAQSFDEIAEALERKIK